MSTEETVKALRPELDALLTDIRNTDEDRHAVGQMLNALRNKYPRGTWSKELAERAEAIGVAPRTARFYMQCAVDPDAQRVNVQRQRVARAAKRQTFATVTVVAAPNTAALWTEERARDFLMLSADQWATLGADVRDQICTALTARVG